MVVRAGSSNAEAILEECQNLLPCVLIIDEDSLAKIDPLLFARRVEYGRLIPVLALVKDESPASSEMLLRMGCMGFLQAESPPWQFRRAVDAVDRGELWASRLLLSQLCRDFLSAHDPCKLTDREQEILALMARGYKNREIAASLFITRETVRWHIRAINAKLGICDRKSAVAYAAHRNLRPRRVRSEAGSDRTIAV